MTEPVSNQVPRAARIAGAVGRTMITAGVVVLLFVAFQLWGTEVQEARAQDGLRGDFESRLAAAAELDPDQVSTQPTHDNDADDSTGSGESADTDAESATSVEADPVLAGEVDPDVLALFFPAEGDPLARIEIPSIEVDKVAVRGVAVADLRRGPGHYSQSAFPGNDGNAAIAGHRTTYGAPFNRIDELQPGDEINVTSVQGRFTYRVMDPVDAFRDSIEKVDSVGDGHIIVHPTASWVLGEFGDDRLTLTACHPKLSSRQRIIVAAELVDPVVEVPEWVADAEAARADSSDTPLSSESESEIADPADDTSAVAESPQAVSAPADLDEGLNGERDAIPGAVLWMIAATALWYGGGVVGRRIGFPLRARLAALVPVGVCLWFAFELIDRALPAA